METKPHIYEVAYEVCNKVGGIYTVLESKAQEMVRHYGENYCAVGFFDKSQANIEFDETEPSGNIKKIFEELGNRGIECYYGKWLISGRPNTILIDTSRFAGETNTIKGELWDKYDVDSLRSGIEFNEPVLWAYAAGVLIGKLLVNSKNPVSIAQFHEWMSGAGLLYLENFRKNNKNNNLKIATVFTTHATILGRTMANAGEKLHKIVREGIEKSEIAGADTARKYGVLDKHTMEKACANNCDVFTAVSELTSREAQYILGKRADVVLPNGLNMDKFLTIDELTVMKKTRRKQMKRFLRAFFSRYYHIDFNNIRSAFISGRYEFHNKGINLFIDALGKLNERLKKEKAECRKNKILISFIFVPTKTYGENTELIRNKLLYAEMEEQVENELDTIKDRIIDLLTTVKVPAGTREILSDEFLQRCRRLSAHFSAKHGQAPPLSAFNLASEYNDSIINALRRNELNNHETDQVKVVFYPAYLSSADRLIGMDYNDAILTFDTGVFPSYYESWGYTPLEAAAQGIPAVTTDLSGYGKFINNLKEEGTISDGGMYVLKRDGRIWEDMVNDLSDRMYEITVADKKELAKLRRNAKEISGFADWKFLIKYYIEAHEMAVEKIGGK